MSAKCIWSSAVSAAAVVFALYLPSPALAQPVLLDHIEVRAARQGENATVFTVLGARREQEVVFTLVNADSTNGVLLAPGVVGNLRVRATRNGQAFPIVTDWGGITIARDGVGEVEGVAGTETLLGAGEWIRLAAVIRPVDAPQFDQGVYALTFDKGLAAGDIRSADGALWGGRYTRTATVTILFAEPSAPDEIRSQHRVEGGEAGRRGQWAQALQHFQAILKANPADRGAHAAAGEAYSRLGRFKEAVVEYEAALVPSMFENGSLLPVFLAYAYVGIGDTARAEALLSRKGLSPGMARSEIEKYRAALKSEFPQR
jgi:hypothetical protein